jgi:hypothetical protein
VYASTRGVEGIPDGVHWYDAARHALVHVGPAATGAVTTLVVTGVPWRTGWRYAERGWRHMYWDAGTLLSQLTAAAASAGLEPRLRSMFPDAALRELVGADGVHEHPVALVSFGDGEAAIAATGPAAAGDLPPVELPLCTSARARASGRAGGTLAGRPSALGRAAVGPLDEVVRRRGSQRLMDRSRTLPRALLEWPMAAAMRGIEVPHWVAVHGVDGVPPDCTVARPLDAAAEGGPARRAGTGRSGPDARRRRRVRRHLGLAAVRVGRPELPRGAARGGAGRRRLHLAAYALERAPRA